MIEGLMMSEFFEKRAEELLTEYIVGATKTVERNNFQYELEVLTKHYVSGGHTGTKKERMKQVYELLNVLILKANQEKKKAKDEKEIKKMHLLLKALTNVRNLWHNYYGFAK